MVGDEDIKMEILKDWWQQPLADEIYQCLRERESALPAFLAQSPQLAQRRYLVDWLAIIWEKHSLCMSARQLAITLLDFFMDRFDIEARQLHLVAIGSLLVATKFEERETNIPRIADLNKHVPEPGFTSSEYLQMELLLLDFYMWNVGLPTPAHFTDLFLRTAVQSGSTMLNGRQVEYSRRVQEHQEKYTDYFLEISMQDHFYRDYRPSHVAAACVACSRVCLGLTPHWSAALEKVSMYPLAQLSPLMQSLLSTHQKDELQSVPPTPPPTPKHEAGDLRSGPMNSFTSSGYMCSAATPEYQRDKHSSHYIATELKML